MNKEQLEKFKAWFDSFTARHYGADEFVNANIKMKDEHSRRVREEMLYLANELKLDENQRLLAETIGLFHDVGRFPQFTKYRTYNDPRSVNHCLLALDVLKKEKVLSPLSAEEQQIIEKAIEFHGVKQIPENLAGDTLLFSKMIRDADKIDIYNVITKSYIQHRDDPDNFKLEIELPDIPGCSHEVIDAIMTGRLIDYKNLRSWNDIKLCSLGWVYDVNFIPSLKRIRQRRFLETIFDFLPDNPDIRNVRDKIFAYVDSRLKAG
jgi:HD superfamily phosphohydrolase YqeK